MPWNPSRTAIAFALLAVLVATTWAMSNVFTPPVVRACRARYLAARTAADTIQVDLTIVPEGRQLAEPRSCGSFRHAARWQ